MRIKLLLHYIIPHHAFSRLVGLLARWRNRRFRDWSVKRLIRLHHVELDSATETQVEAYPHFNAFFTRTLKPERRPIVEGEHTLACPVDGTLSQFGQTDAQQRLIQAKGHHYSIRDLLGGDDELASEFAAAHYATFYLGPRDYHRVHMPIDGQLQQMIYIPGRLFSVNALSVEHVPNLFARNERVVSTFTTKAGKLAVILVGAIVVGSIETTWHGLVTPPHAHNLRCWYYYDKNISLKKGKEMGHFRLGSTVILLFNSKRVEWDKRLSLGNPMQFGQMIGQFNIE